MKSTFNSLVIFFFMAYSCAEKSLENAQIMTVRGFIAADSLGITLEHEHIATDFTGAELVPQPQYTTAYGLAHLLPQFQGLKALGVNSFIECTPEYIGRDVLLLKALSEQSGIHVVTNTGYYAAADKKYLPSHAYTETSEQLAERWMDEWKNGIKGTGIKPGFIKLGVGKATLDSTETKLVRAGALAHLGTGLKVAVHTGGSQAALDEIAIFDAEGVSTEALIVVHSQNTDPETQLDIARRGAWVSLDGIDGRDETIDRYLQYLLNFKQNTLLDKVLISHDDGWAVTKQDSISFERFGNRPEAPFSPIFTMLLPKLRASGFSEQEIDLLLIRNPAAAFTVRVCRK